MRFSVIPHCFAMLWFTRCVLGVKCKQNWFKINKNLENAQRTHIHKHNRAFERLKTETKTKPIRMKMTKQRATWLKWNTKYIVAIYRMWEVEVGGKNILLLALPRSELVSSTTSHLGMFSSMKLKTKAHTNVPNFWRFDIPKIAQTSQDRITQNPNEQSSLLHRKIRFNVCVLKAISNRNQFRKSIQKVWLFFKRNGCKSFAFIQCIRTIFLHW